MASARKRSAKDKRFVAYYTDRANVRRQKLGFESKSATEQLARKLEDDERKIREGLVVPAEETRKAADRTPIAAHIEDYRAILAAKDNDPKHCAAIASALRRLLAATEARSVGEITKNNVLLALKAWKDRGRSARTLNHALGAVKAFCRWLADSERIARVPMGLLKIDKYNEDADRHLVRRALTKAELDRLLAAAEAGPDRVVAYGKTKSKLHATTMTGPERAALYRLAMGTGFRANEIRTLTPECFRLDGPKPAIVLSAKHAKNGREAVQPITRELADGLRPFLAGKAPGRPVLVVPEKAAKLLRSDLDAAGIAYGRKVKGRAGEGVVDFHAIRHSYGTHLVESGANPRIVQVLMRHSDVRLTMQTYYSASDDAARDALEGGK